MKLADTSIRRPVFAVMLIGALVVLGAVSIPRLGIDLWPRIEFPMVVVSTVLEGAAPETMEREVSQVLEESINTIEGISSLRSISSDSLSIIYVEFDLEYDIQEKAQEVRDKVAAVSGELPRDVETPVVERVDPDAQPILVVMLAGPQSIRTISEFADKRLKPRLERIPGVGSVTLAGSRKREIRIWIDPLRLGGYGLAVDDVLGALQREHVEMPGGRLETESREWALRTEGKLTSAEQFGAVVVADRGGSVIHLRDVANVEDGMAEERTISQLNGRRGVALQVRRQSGENTVAVADAVKRELEIVRADLPPGYEMLVARDASRFIRSSIYDVVGALLIGAVLASIVVFLFLRDLRSTLITAVAIPTSIMATFIFFYFFGFTLNTMTLMALSLSIGLLIDDAIVVLENTFRHMELGAPPKQAASTGTRRDRSRGDRDLARDRRGLRADRLHVRRRRSLLPRVRDRRHLRRLHVGAGGADAGPHALLPLSAAHPQGGVDLPGARVALRAPRDPVPPHARLGAAPPPGDARARRRGRGRRRRHGARRARHLRDSRGPRRVQRLAQAAARQHRPHHAGGDGGRRAASCGAARRSRPSSRRSGPAPPSA